MSLKKQEWEGPQAFDLLLELFQDVVTYVPVIFRASGLVTLFVACWAVNIYAFDAFGLPFRKTLGLRPTDAQMDSTKSAAWRLFLALLVSYPCYELCAAYEFDLGMSMTQILFWVGLVYHCFWSSHPGFVSFRLFLRDRVITFYRSESLGFVDVFVADALCSLSKLLADMQIVVCSLIFLLYQDHYSSNRTCMHGLVGPSLASIPYLIRCWQCITSYRLCGSKWQLYNIAKYLSSFPVIWLSALKHHLDNSDRLSDLINDEEEIDEHDKALNTMWIYAVIVNTIFSFLWDVVMDWGLDGSSKRYPLLRKTLKFKYPAVYYTAILFDFLFRIGWSLKLSQHLHHVATGQAFIFLFEVLEIIRRFMWNFFRVEWECVREELLASQTSPSEHSADIY